MGSPRRTSPSAVVKRIRRVQATLIATALALLRIDDMTEVLIFFVDILLTARCEHYGVCRRLWRGKDGPGKSQRAVAAEERSLTEQGVSSEEHVTAGHPRYLSFYARSDCLEIMKLYDIFTGKARLAYSSNLSTISSIKGLFLE